MPKKLLPCPLKIIIYRTRQLLYLIIIRFSRVEESEGQFDGFDLEVDTTFHNNIRESKSLPREREREREAALVARGGG